VNSTRSTNRIETTLRSSGAEAVRTSGEPQFWQNRAVSVFCSPQVGHRTTGRVYRGEPLDWPPLFATDGTPNQRGRYGQLRRADDHEAVEEVPDQGEQSTATERAAHICRIRASPSRPRRSTRTATDTLSTESRFTAERRGTGSSLGSRTTSLARPRIVVVHGATTARRSRGMAASRDKTTTGRLPASASSHHQTSPRAGIGITWPLQLRETRPGCPTHRAR
jgi:hypothetical protein